VERGLSEESMSLFMMAIESSEASEVENMTMAFARVMGGDEAQKEISKILARKKNALQETLVRKLYGKS
tara:strand:- start:240 stop:446 length:207 start_codon:yes stop_codon:yes gene_type:complete